MSADASEQDNRQLSRKLAIVAVGMFGFGFALVPFYNQICAALGVNSIEAKAEAPANTQIDYSRKRDDRARLQRAQHAVALQAAGEPRRRCIRASWCTVEYEVVNVRGAPVTGQAVPSYGPQRAGEYFKKIECFCFTQQTLAAGETRRMPVIFVVDPKLPKDVNTIALSYTFFEVAGRGGKS